MLIEQIFNKVRFPIDSEIKNNRNKKRMGKNIQKSHKNNLIVLIWISLLSQNIRIWESCHLIIGFLTDSAKKLNVDILFFWMLGSPQEKTHSTKCTNIWILILNVEESVDIWIFVCKVYKMKIKKFMKILIVLQK